jgi:hypothetical protein
MKIDHETAGPGPDDRRPSDPPDNRTVISPRRIGRRWAPFLVTVAVMTAGLTHHESLAAVLACIAEIGALFWGPAKHH